MAALAEWQKLVKKVQTKEKCTYREAQQKAKPQWDEMKVKKAKKEAKETKAKAKVEKVEKVVVEKVKKEKAPKKIVVRKKQKEQVDTPISV